LNAVPKEKVTTANVATTADTEKHDEQNSDTRIIPQDARDLLTALEDVLGDEKAKIGVLENAPGTSWIVRNITDSHLFRKLSGERQYFYTAQARALDFSWKKENGISTQGERGDVSHILCFPLDLDLKVRIAGKTKEHGTYSDIEEAREALRRFPLPPSFVVSSGHGLQALWLLNEAQKIGEDIDERTYAHVVASMIALIGEGPDSITQVNAVFRLPGSNNLKDKTSPQPARIIERSDARYELEDFTRYTSITAAPLLPSAPSPIEKTQKLQRTDVDHRPSSELEEFLRTGVDPAHPSNTDNSSKIQAAVKRLRWEGFTDDEIFTLLTDESNKISEKLYTDMHSDVARQRYIARSLAKAPAPPKTSGKHEKKAQVNTEDQVHTDADEEERDGVRVTGYLSDHTVLFWKGGQIQRFKLKEMRKEDMQLLFSRTDIKNVEEWKSWIVRRCIAQGMLEDERVSMGVWHLEKKLTVLSGKDFFQVEDGRIRRLTTPAVSGRIIEAAAPWLNMERFYEHFSTRVSLLDVYNKLYQYVDQWSWTDRSMVAFMTSFLMLAPFQKAMSWKPYVYVQGRAGSGKTHFFINTFEMLYGRLIARLDNASFSGAQQLLSTRASVPIFDNFEATRDAVRILELFQSSSRGKGAVVRGSPSGKARSAELDHMLFMSAVAPASRTTGANDSRTVVFRLGVFEKLKPARVWTDDESSDFAAKMLAGMLQQWEDIERTAKRYMLDGSRREVDNVAYTLALQELVSESIVDLPDFVKERSVIEDGEHLLHTILTTRTTSDGEADHGVRLPVWTQLVQSRSLSERGIRLSQDKKHIILEPDLIARYLLHGTQYAELANVKDLLLTAVGARETRGWLNKKRSSGLISVPADVLKEYSENDEGTTGDDDVDAY